MEETMRSKTVPITIAVVAIVAVSLSYGIKGYIVQRNAGTAELGGFDKHDDYDDHDEAGHENGDHTGCDEHESHSGQEEHDDEDVVSLSDEAMELAGIQIDTVRLGKLHKVIELPGEVGFNEDRLVHITPRFGGIAREVLRKLGDYVRKDEKLAIIESNESMSPYTLRAPMSGWIVEKHISNGEFVSEESSVYVIADLSNVWVNLAVYPKDAEHIEPGQRVTLKCLGSNLCAEGTISYISHAYSEDTRRLTARVVLSNEDGMWKPGMFVRATSEVESGEEKVVVAKDAVQIVNQMPAVFIVKGDHEFEPVGVVTGERGSRLIEILKGGIEVGDRYVSQGAFEIKAHLVTGSLDAHAGHGH